MKIIIFSYTSYLVTDISVDSYTGSKWETKRNNAFCKIGVMKFRRIPNPVLSPVSPFWLEQNSVLLYPA